MEILRRKTLIEWLDQKAHRTNLIAPIDLGGVLLYRKINNSRDVVWDYSRPVLSAKEFFFSATERLLSIEKTGQTIRVEETFADQDQVLFGVRPCDARGIASLDALFIDSDPVDQNYAKRRHNSVMIGLACSEKTDTCFCTDIGGAPDDPTGMDILLKESDVGFEVLVMTPKGSKIAVKEWGMDFAGVSDPPPHRDSKPNLPVRDVLRAQFNDRFWRETSERCLSCRICAYVCPTCRCFDIRDESIRSDNGSHHFERIRCWDSCAGEVYRRIAGGHNPRAEKSQRLRNRFYCKFYYYPEQYGPVACTGCGRCVDYCPVNIDITELIDNVRMPAEQLGTP